MCKEEACNCRPWIKKEYLEKLPRYEPSLYKEREVKAHEVLLYFRTPFNLVLFMNLMVNAFVFNGMSWNSIEIQLMPGQRFLMRLRVNGKPESNKMEIKFVKAFDSGK